MEIFKKQSLKRILSEANENKERTLSALDLTLMSVGSVIGTGVMVLTGIVAAKQSGPATSIAFIGGGIAAAIILELKLDKERINNVFKLKFINQN